VCVCVLHELLMSCHERGRMSSTCHLKVSVKMVHQYQTLPSTGTASSIIQWFAHTHRKRHTLACCSGGSEQCAQEKRQSLKHVQFSSCTNQVLLARETTPTFAVVRRHHCLAFLASRITSTWQKTSGGLFCAITLWQKALRNNAARVLNEI
jgi:hypothetical protein